MIQQSYFWVYIQKNWKQDIKAYPTFIEALFTIAKGWKKPKCPSIDEGINKMWYIHTGEYYSALKRKEILSHAYNMDEPWGHYTGWDKPVTKGQILYDSTYMRYLKRKMCLPKGWGWKNWELYLGWFSSFGLQDEKVPEIGYTTMWIHFTPLSCTLKNG